MSEETRTLYLVQTRICGMWSMVRFYDTLEDAREALRVCAKIPKVDAARIVKETREVVG